MILIRSRPLILSAMLILFSVVLIGCASPTFLTGPGGKLTITSRVDEKVKVRTGFETGVYSLDDRNQLTMVLFDGDPKQPRAAMTVRILWRPRAARTPIAPTATNATVHYIVFRDQPVEGGQDDAAAPIAQAAVYSGAGFVYPYSKLGKKNMRIGVWDASLRLHDATAGFIDELGAAEVKGRFTVRRDDQAIHQLLHGLNVEIRQRLGYPRLVRSDAADAAE